MLNIQLSPATLDQVAGSVVGTAGPLVVEDHELHPIGVPPFSMTTAGLWRLRGRATDGTDHHEFSAVLKVIHTPLRWSGIEAVPENMRGYLMAHNPWRTEAQVYESTLQAHLPEGLRIPDIYLLEDLDPESTGIWMEDVTEDPQAVWDQERFVRMAYLLGRLAGVADAPAGESRELTPFVVGPGEHVYIPMLRSGLLHTHPALIACVDERLEHDMLALVDQIPALLAEHTTLPRRRSHGDACPQNLLQTTHGAVAIDWGSFGTTTAGFDLGQLLAGRVNEGLMDGEQLPALFPLCLDAYLQGLHEESAPLPSAVVRRGVAISMAVSSGLSALFPRQLHDPDSEDLPIILQARAGMARFILDELTTSSPHS